MGPEPMTRTERRSSRLGMARPRAASPAPALRARPRAASPAPAFRARPRAASPAPAFRARPLHQRAERVELARRVVRARRRLGVVLHAERGRVEQPDPLD